MGIDDIQSQLLSLLQQAKDGLIAALPNIVTAALVLIVGWWLAWALRKVVRRIVGGLAVKMPPGATRAAWTEAVDERDAGSAAANGVYWLVLLTTLMVAVDALGLAVFSKWSATLAGYLPKLFIALALVFGGVVAGRVASNAIIKTAHRLLPAQARSLARLTQVSIVVAMALIAADQLGVDVSFLTAVFLITIATMLGGAALAFGLGARDVMSDILAMHYVNKSYRPGQVVRVGSDEGRILRTTHTGVVLDSAEGETAIPGRHFSGNRCVLLNQEEERGS
ncbi:MAG: hypothetical protein WBG86_22555 [Polyangiales bacterium]